MPEQRVGVREYLLQVHQQRRHPIRVIPVDAVADLQKAHHLPRSAGQRDDLNIRGVAQIGAAGPGHPASRRQNGPTTPAGQSANGTNKDCGDSLTLAGHHPGRMHIIQPGVGSPRRKGVAVPPRVPSNIFSQPETGCITAARTNCCEASGPVAPTPSAHFAYSAVLPGSLWIWLRRFNPKAVVEQRRREGAKIERQDQASPFIQAQDLTWQVTPNDFSTCR